MINAHCDKCGGRWLPRCPGEDAGPCPWCEIRRLREELDFWRRLAKTAGNAFADLLAVCGEGNAIWRPCDIIHRADWRRMQNWQKEIEAVENAREG